MTSATRRLTLTEQDRRILGKRKILKADREAIPDLWEPFRDAYVAKVRPADVSQQALWRAFRFCGQMMLALDCSYWAFTWDRLLAWRAAEKARTTDHPAIWHRRGTSAGRR